MPRILDATGDKTEVNRGSILLLAGHQGPESEVLEKWIEQGRSDTRPFEGKHLVVAACNMSPAMMYNFVEIAITQCGAQSVCVPSGIVESIPFTLAAGRATKTDTSTNYPLEYWRQCYESVRIDLLDCKTVDDLEQKFGAVHRVFLDANGKLDSRLLRKVIEQMEAKNGDPTLFDQFGYVHQPLIGGLA